MRRKEGTELTNTILFHWVSYRGLRLQVDNVSECKLWDRYGESGGQKGPKEKKSK